MPTSIDSLTIMNDFMFSTVMKKEEFCIPFLEAILGVKIRSITYLNTQESIQAEIPDSRGVRLDVYVEDDANTVYDIDMQTTSNSNLAKRMRMYQSMIDARALEAGDDFNLLKKSFVIFITTYDPFGADRYVYTFRSRCDEDSSIVLKDAATKIVVNTMGTVGEVNPELATLIRYMKDGDTGNEYTDKLDREVQLIRNDEKWRHDYMTLAQRDTQNKYVGKHSLWVEQVRKNSTRFAVKDMEGIFQIPEEDCKEILDLIAAHPDWSDDEIADHVMWEEWK